MYHRTLCLRDFIFNLPAAKVFGLKMFLLRKSSKHLQRLPLFRPTLVGEEL